MRTARGGLFRVGVVNQFDRCRFTGGHRQHVQHRAQSRLIRAGGCGDRLVPRVFAVSRSATDNPLESTRYARHVDLGRGQLADDGVEEPAETRGAASGHSHLPADGLGHHVVGWRRSSSGSAASQRGRTGPTPAACLPGWRGRGERDLAGSSAQRERRAARRRVRAWVSDATRWWSAGFRPGIEHHQPGSGRCRRRRCRRGPSPGPCRTGEQRETSTPPSA